MDHVRWSLFKFLYLSYISRQKANIFQVVQHTCTVYMLKVIGSIQVLEETSFHGQIDEIFPPNQKQNDYE